MPPWFLSGVEPLLLARSTELSRVTSLPHGQSEFCPFKECGKTSCDKLWTPTSQHSQGQIFITRRETHVCVQGSFERPCQWVSDVVTKKMSRKHLCHVAFASLSLPLLLTGTLCCRPISCKNNAVALCCWDGRCVLRRCSGAASCNEAASCGALYERPGRRRCDWGGREFVRPF